MVFRPQVDSIAAGASNIRGGDNPPFTVEDFRAMYPLFWVKETVSVPAQPPKRGKKAEPQAAYTPRIPLEVIELYVELAHACVKQSRFRGAWKVCMGYFVAHFVTLYLQTVIDPEFATPQAVAAAGQTKGLMASKSVDGVSASYDFSYVMQDLDGWAAWKLTTYGTQFATFAKAYGMGGMRVT